MARPLTLAAVAAVYAVVGVLVGTLLAPVLVTAALLVDPLMLLFVTGLAALVLGVSGQTPTVPTAITFGIVAVATTTVFGAGALTDVIGVASDGSVFALRGLAGWGGLVVAAVVALPLAARAHAWRTVESNTVDARPLTAVVPERYADQVPERLPFRELDDATPAAYVFQDGRRAAVGLTTGALDALDDRERDALLAREVTRVVERTPVATFWASALAAGTAALVRPLATPSDVAGVGDQAANPHPLAPAAKLVAAPFVLALVYYLPATLLAVEVPLRPAILAGALAVLAVATAVGTAALSRRLARRVARQDVLAADEAGAVLADDATGLGDALETLHEHATVRESGAPGDAAASTGDEYRVSVSANGQVKVGGAGTTLDAFEALAHTPTDLVPLADRRRALATVAQRLEDRPDDPVARTGAAGAQR